MAFCYLDTNCISLLIKFARVHGWEKVVPVLQGHDLLTGLRNFQELRLGGLAAEYAELARHLPVYMFFEDELSSFEMLTFTLGPQDGRHPIRRWTREDILMAFQPTMRHMDEQAKPDLVARNREMLERLERWQFAERDLTASVFALVMQFARQNQLHLQGFHARNMYLLSPATLPVNFTWWALLYVRFIREKHFSYTANDLVDLLSATCAPLTVRFYSDDAMIDLMHRVKAFRPTSLYAAFKRAEKLRHYQASMGPDLYMIRLHLTAHKKAASQQFPVLEGTELLKYRDLRQELETLTQSAPGSIL